jgi:2-octaprenyl-6-methoxyphenol hydroxylase
MADLAVDVCVVGAGPVGGTLACRLAAGGVRVAVIDRAALPPMEHPDFDGRAYAVAAGSRRLLEAAGIWDALPQAPSPIFDIRVSDGRVGQRASSLFLHFDHQDVGNEPFGWMVEARALRV